MSAPVTLKLQYPVQFGSETITELVFRRPKGKDLKARKHTDGDEVATLDLIGRLTNQPPKVVDEMDVNDIEEASKIIAGFRKSGQETGEGPTP